jgi:hypothetical protein
MELETNGNYVTFKVLTAAGMKLTVFWDAAAYSMVETDCHFRSAYSLHHHHHHHPDDGRSKHPRNTRQFLPDYMVQHPRRQSPFNRIMSNRTPR